MPSFRLVLLAPLLPALALAQPTVTSPSKIVNLPAVVKQPTTVDAKGFLGVIGQNIAPHATLKSKSNGAPLAGKKLKFWIRGQGVGADLTDASGEAKVHYQVPNEHPGNWPVEIRFEGDDEYLPSSTAVTMGVFQASTKLTLHQIKTQEGCCRQGDRSCCSRDGETLDIEGALVRTSDGAGVDGRAIKLTVNGKGAGTPATTSIGFWYPYKLPPGTSPLAHIQAQFDGDPLYAASAATLDIPVNGPARKGTLTLFDAKGKRGETIALKALLSPENPMVTVNGLAGGLGVAFKRSEGADSSAALVQVCSATTGPAGVVSCTIKLDLPKKSYSLSAHPHPGQSDWVVPQPHDKTLVIEPAASRLVVTGAPSSARIGDTIHVKVKVTRTTDSAAIRDGLVSTSLGGTATPNAAGEATVTVSISSQGGTGARTVKVWFSGDPDLYEKSEATFTLQVSPSVS